jgi:UDP-N-acetylglucosamine 4,6-dehydratase
MIARAFTSSRSILVTGATGTFGRAFIRRVLQDRLWDRVVAYSRDEVKQAALFDEFGVDGPRLFLGDVRDGVRLGLAMRGIDTVVHAAALKRVDVGAYSPSELIATNVIGTMNVVNAAIAAGVRRVVVISSDKACAATNMYGATKFCGETYAVQSNAYGYPSGTLVAAVRYGNILGSRGSVVHTWRRQVERGEPLTVTSRAMTRFVMTIEAACDLVLFAVEHMRGGEVFVPVLPSAKVVDLAYAVAGMRGYPLVDVAVRPGGEKLAESLLNEEEPSRTVRLGPHYAISPSHHEWTSEPWPGDPVPPSLSYRSDTNDWWLDWQGLAKLIAVTEACRA